MAKLLSFLSWNVENFSNKSARVDRVADAIAAKSPDVFGLFEVKGAAVFDAFTAKMPGYAFTITESESVPEILVGVRNGLSAFVTQKNELQSKTPSLRPGALATITLPGGAYSFLFLHLKSFADPRDWGLRDDMFRHVAKLKRAVDKKVGGNANFIALGDINTMGMNAPYNDESDMDGAKELSFVDNRMAAAHTKLRRLSKTHDASWWNGSDNWDPSALDHVYASEHLSFTDQNGAEVLVDGWVNETTKANRRRWIEDYSDHCMLYGEIAE